MQLSFSDFKSSWLTDVTEGSPTTIQLGQRFSQKLISQWLDLDSESLDVTYCDGAGDGGIDVAVLDRSVALTTEETLEGDTWYLVQSKYGSAFAGDSTLLVEGKKIIDTLDGQRKNLSSLSSNLLEKLVNFRKSATDNDRIKIVYATVDPLTDDQRRTLDDVRSLARARLGSLLDVDAISIKTIFDSQIEEAELAAQRRLTVSLTGHLAEAGNDLLVGSVSLTNLYEFLKSYRSQTGNLDQLFERNVRKFLGGRVRVNKGMQTTLRQIPERFGLFNNGITVTVSNFKVDGHGSYELIEPYVVNGCQTTRTIWEVMSNRFEAGGSGVNVELEEWKARAAKGCVVAKIAKVGSEGEALLQDITRYTNSQNAVREKDFIAIDQGFKSWHKVLADKFDIYLEIQRGGWDSQRALQKQKPSGHQFSKWASALDLTKVFGAGWFSEAGLAFGKNPPFLPNGSIFTRMISREGIEPSFGADDLFAAYLLLESSKRLGFGRGGPTTRRQTKFLYYFAFISLLRDSLQKEGLGATDYEVSLAIIRLLQVETVAGRALEEAAAAMIDNYLTQSDDNSVFKESKFQESGDLNAFLKWEQLGRNLDETKGLQAQLHFQKQFVGMSVGGSVSTRKLVA